jgi:protein-tyrosine phosphatase
LDYVESATQIGCPGSIINLRQNSDPPYCCFGADCFHFPISNDYEKYHTSTPEVRRWLVEILGVLAGSVRRYPILIHCTSGKDRTGVVVAALLHVLGVPRAWIVEEHLLSEGEVCRGWIEGAINGFPDAIAYFKGVDLARLKRFRQGR